jgi:hypothetical protein
MSILDDPDFRFYGARQYGGHFNETAWLDDKMRYHKTDGPAYHDADGNDIWYFEGKIHRPGGEPAFIGRNGDRGWYENGVPHRAGGLPALAFANADREWFEKGERHREDGPAVMRGNGHEEWWVRGRQLGAAEIEERLFALRDPEAVARRGETVRQDFSNGLQKPLKPNKPVSFRPRRA